MDGYAILIIGSIAILLVLLSVMLNLPKRFRRRCRNLDMRYLWRACVTEAQKQNKHLDHAKAAFAVHVFHDNAWTRDFSKHELFNFIDNLTEKSDKPL